MISNRTPPGDGLADYYAWAKYLDGATFVRFFNDLAIYGEAGQQERALVFGRSARWTFSVGFAEHGLLSQAPEITASWSDSDSREEVIFSRPETLPGETHRDLTLRWLRMVYWQLCAWNSREGEPFRFPRSGEWYYDQAAIVTPALPTFSITETFFPQPDRFTGGRGTVIPYSGSMMGSLVSLSEALGLSPGTWMVTVVLVSYDDPWVFGGGLLGESISVVLQDGFGWAVGASVGNVSRVIPTFSGLVQSIRLCPRLSEQDAVILSANG